MEAENPCRHPAWRFRRATVIANEKEWQLNSIRDDELTLDCARYLTEELTRGENPQKRSRELTKANSPVNLGAELYTNPRYRSLRYEVEARVIAGETRNAIYLATGLSAEVIHAYENIFFQVRDRLQAVEYIMNHVIKISPTKGWHGLNNRGQLLYMAYTGGPRMVDLTLFCMRATGKSQVVLRELVLRAVTSVAQEGTYDQTVLSEEMRNKVANYFDVFSRPMKFADDGRGTYSASCTMAAGHRGSRAA